MFFERNGLRHGEFTLRESQYAAQVGSEQRRWGYRVREVGWSSDSNILSVWIDREDSDIGELQCFMAIRLSLTVYSAIVDHWKLPLVRNDAETLSITH